MDRSIKQAQDHFGKKTKRKGNCTHGGQFERESVKNLTFFGSVCSSTGERLVATGCGDALSDALPGEQLQTCIFVHF